MRKPSQRSPKRITAQAMVEFALALPILLLVVYGLLETGRLLFIYASVVTAARQAARYGAASGDIGNGTLYYNDCAGIQAAANKVAFIQKFSSIIINYDTGPTSAELGVCNPSAPKTFTDNLHRIKVTVSAQFTPIVPLVPFKPFVITSTSNRTILTGVSIAVDPAIATLAAGGGGGPLALSKACTPNTFSGSGQIINYTLHVSNPTSAPIINILLDDPMFPGGISCPGGIPFNLNGGASKDCTASYTTTQGDVNAAGPIKNTAKATGIDSNNVAVAGIGTCTVNFIATPVVALTKTGTVPSTIAPGTLVTYTFTLTNNGNVALSAPYTIVDNLIGSNWHCPGDALPVGGSITCTGTYALSNHDISVGQVDNSAKATGTYKSTPWTSNTATATVLTPSLLLTLTADKTSVSAAGQVITFTYTLKNRTASTMNNIKVSDTLGYSNSSCVASLAPQQTGTCTSTYTVTQANIDASTVITDTASAVAQGGINSNQSGVTITVVQSPVLTLTKDALPKAPTAPAKTFNVGQLITYTYTLKNDVGNVTLKAPFTVTDDKLGTVCTFSSGTLPPGGTPLTCTKTYPLTQADLDAGALINKATATGVFSTQTVTSAQATQTVITFTDPRMALVKTASVSFFTSAGDSWTYTYTLKNTGGQPLVVNAPYTLTDNVLVPHNFTCGGSNINLPLGGSVGCKTISYTATANDYTNKGVTNTVIVAAGSTTTPALTNSPTATLKVPLFVCDPTTLHGSSLSPGPDGPDVTWTITNDTGLPIHIAYAIVMWSNNNAKLNQVFLNGLSVYSGSGNPGISIPGVPWTLNLGANPLRLLFNPPATAVKIQVGFTEAACSFPLSSP